MQRVVELKIEPVVGKRYLVPCVLDSFPRHNRRYGIWLPIIGDAHDDKEFIGVAKAHWHFDFRFMRECLMRFPMSFGSVYFINPGETIFIGEKRRKCLRTMPPYDVKHEAPFGQGRYCRIPWLKRLEAAYASSKVVNVQGCRTCPHRGLPLDGLPEEPDGSVVCRGHGLCWSKDGSMVRRVSQ